MAEASINPATLEFLKKDNAKRAKQRKIMMIAAPLLIAYTQEDRELVAWLAELERLAPSVSWIDSRYGLATLAPMLTRRLRCEIDNGQEVVLRFYDPRILLGLPSALTAQQKRYFFAPVTSWTAWEPRRAAYYGIEAEPATAVDSMIDNLPGHVWEQLVQRKRMEALFELAPAPGVAGDSV